MSEEPVRGTMTVQADGRTTIPDSVREARGLKGKKAFFEVETFGKDKILLTIMSTWTPDPKRKGPGRDVLHKG
jgi:bifunctional DNA-binding transcriptional regulator/antitoxin component of YhaV-PrlF toxin-antitoxin module